MDRFRKYLAFFLTFFLLAGAPTARGQALCVDADGVRWTVTEAGEILHSPDGEAWTVFDFNAQYAGFYPQMHWRAVAAGGGTVMVAGVAEDGRPVAFTSPRGSVWSERELSYLEQGTPRLLETAPTALSYDAQQDSFLLECSDGAQLELPGCSHCNRLWSNPLDTYYAQTILTTL